jgi:hypothetical protein
MDPVHCPHCSGSIAFDNANAGQSMTCPHCAGVFQMPLPVALSESPYRINPVKRSAIGPKCQLCGGLMRRQTGYSNGCGGEILAWLLGIAGLLTLYPYTIVGLLLLLIALIVSQRRSVLRCERCSATVSAD